MSQQVYEPCVLGPDGKCTRGSHQHAALCEKGPCTRAVPRPGQRYCCQPCRTQDGPLRNGRPVHSSACDMREMRQPGDPAAAAPRGSLIPEPEYHAHAATEATRTEDLLRYAASENDEGDQIVSVLEEVARDLAGAGMKLRVVARHLAAGNVPGADRYKLAQLAASWEHGRLADRQAIAGYDSTRLIAATLKAAAVQLREYLDLPDPDEDER